MLTPTTVTAAAIKDAKEKEEIIHIYFSVGSPPLALQFYYAATASCAAALIKESY